MGSRNLATYEYNGNNETTHGGNRALSRMTYGNGDFITYTYDHLGRVATETWDDGTEYVYFYNAEGNLSKKVDTATGSGVNYEYDSLDRLIHSYQVNGDGETVQRTEHLYDTSNRLSTQTWQLLDADGEYSTYSETYTYDVGDDLLTYVDGNGFGDYAYTYDLLRRLETKYCWIYTQTFHYRNLSDSRTTTQIARIDYTAGTSGEAFDDFSLAYEYDNLGNIKKITGTNITGYNAEYTYDTYGNIRSVSDVKYTYGNDQLRDLLTAYDSETITHDEIGNPTSLYRHPFNNYPSQ